MRNSLALFVLFFGAISSGQAGLKEYVQKDDKAFTWKLEKQKEIGFGTLYEIHLTSQIWHEIKWQHVLLVYLPKDAKPTDTMLLWNTGGKPNIANDLLALEIANRVHAPFAFLFDIPNQPLFEGKKEDALIAETFVRFLETKDDSWPLLLPMVKSVVKSMDAIQAFARQEWKFEVKQFVISGASKRGWTSWLTGASGDPRVKAIAPMVIDTLNFEKQLPHQLECFGDYSRMIHDYTERKLVPLPDTAEARKLWATVDPWVYRDKLKMPKMIINGTNDPYWTLDALNLYWDDLPGEKWILYVPNAGHGLEQVYDGNKKDRIRALSTYSAFARHQINNTPMPKMQWHSETKADNVELKITCNPAPKVARIWIADAASRDFRKSAWKAEPTTVQDGTVLGRIPMPKQGYRSYFAECEFEEAGMTYFLSTQMRTIGK